MQIVARQNVVHKRVEALEVVMPGTPESRDLRQRMLSLGILGECQALMLDVAALDRSYAVRRCPSAWLCLFLVQFWQPKHVFRCPQNHVQCGMLMCDELARTSCACLNVLQTGCPVC